jgi:hypothetical protein
MPPRPVPKVGDRRTIKRFLLLPKKLEGEWRWLGFERIKQEFQRYWAYPPEMRAMQVVGWRAVAWDRDEEKRKIAARAAKEMRLRIHKRAVRLWLNDGGHVPRVPGYTAELAFMVAYPPTREKFEKLAAEQLRGNGGDT